MLKYFISMAIALLICSLWSCNHVTGPIKGINVYLLSDATLGIYEIDSSDIPLDSLHLSDTSIISIKDIKSYTWSNHSFILTDSKKAELIQWGDPYPSPNNGNVPFVITVGQERIYLGAFHHAASSYDPPNPYITVMPFVQTIQPAVNSTGPDLRNDSRIHDALKAAGVLIE